MSRGMHRHRRIRLDKLAQIKIDTRKANQPAKRKAAGRRDVRIAAKIKATAAGVPLSPECQSWLSRKTGRAFTVLTQEEIAQAIA